MKPFQTTLKACARSGSVLFSMLLPAYVAWAQTVSGLQLVASVVASGSGSAATGIVTPTAAAPAGGTVVTIGSTNPNLAASAPQVTVAAGQTSVSFPIVTNARYRRGSGLAFNSAISAVKRVRAVDSADSRGLWSATRKLRVE